MMARVQLNASHVSRCVTARREKVPRYIRLLLYNCENEERELLHGSLEFLSFSLKKLVVLSLTWASERDRPQRRRSVFCRFLRWIVVKDGG